MTANLPPGFDRVWGGWPETHDPTTRRRDTANGDAVFVRIFGDRWKVLIIPPKGERIPSYHDTQEEAVAFANTYAESHGGWMTPNRPSRI